MPHVLGAACEQVHVAARERQPDARVHEPVVAHGRLARVDERLGPQRVGEPELGGAAPEALHVLEPAEDAPVPAGHRLEESHAVLEARVERGDAGLVHGNEASVEPCVEHAAEASPRDAAT